MDPAWPSIHILDFNDDNYDVYDDKDDDDSDDGNGALFLGQFLSEFVLRERGGSRFHPERTTSLKRQTGKKCSEGQ